MPAAAAVLLEFGHCYRTRTDQAHVAPDDVEQLGQFVQAGAAQEVAHRRDARVAGQLAVPFPFHRGVRIAREQRGQHRVRVPAHGSELQATEEPAVPADAVMAEEDRRAVRAPDQGRDGHQHRRQQHQQDAGEQPVEPRAECVRDDPRSPPRPARADPRLRGDEKRHVRHADLPFVESDGCDRNPVWRRGRGTPARHRLKAGYVMPRGAVASRLTETARLDARQGFRRRN